MRFILGVLSVALTLPIAQAETLLDTMTQDSQLQLAELEADTSTEHNHVDLQLERQLGASNLANSKAFAEPTQTPQSVVLPGAIEIEGDSLSLHLDRKMIATGNAMMRKGNQQVTGDTVSYDLQNDELEVIGNAKLLSSDSNIAAPSMRMRLNEYTGEMPNASITMTKATDSPSRPNSSSLLNEETALLIADPKRYVDDNLSASNNTSSLTSRLSGSRADAKLILFEGQDKKRLKNVRYTSCAADSDAWYIKAGELELNDYTKSGSATNAVVEFKGVPIMYTPWMNFSYSNQRKSGLLAPTIGTTSRSGFEVLTPFYWNIRPDMDATFAARYLSKRGVQTQGELRYLDESYSGTHNVEYLSNDSQTGENRFYGKLTHRHSFGANWTTGFNLEKVSDDKYFSELSTRIISTSRVNLPQEAFINYQDKHWTFNGLVQKYQNLDDVSFLYHRLPQLTLTSEHDWKGVKAESATQWVYFDRNKNAPKVATGSRFTAFPSLSFPMANSFAYITPKVGVHYANYNLNENTPTGFTSEYNQLSRAIPIFSLDTGLYFDRNTNLFETNYTNTLEPRLFYVSIPYRNQSKIPVFDTALADLNQTTLFTENQFTGQDRINNAGQVSVGITSRLINAETGIERIATTIGQRFYFKDNEVVLPGQIASDRRASDFLAGFTARLSSKLNLDAFWQYDPDQTNTSRTNVLARYNPEPGKVFNFSYRYTANILEQINLAGQWPLGHGWYGVGRYNYSLRDSTAVETVAGLEYDAGCWQARAVMQRIETATANANYAMFFQLELGGLTSIGANPLNILRRNVPGYQSSSEIPEFYRNQNLSQ